MSSGFLIADLAKIEQRYKIWYQKYILENTNEFLTPVSSLSFPSYTKTKTKTKANAKAKANTNTKKKDKDKDKDNGSNLVV